MPLIPRLGRGGWGGYNSRKASTSPGEGGWYKYRQPAEPEAGRDEAAAPAKKAKTAVTAPAAKAASFLANLG